MSKDYFQGAPDLSIEILSPTNTVEEIHDKIVEHFENGTRLVWIIRPDEQYVWIYYGHSPDGFFRIGDRLEGEAVVPEYTLPVAELFAVEFYSDFRIGKPQGYVRESFSE